MKFLIFYAATRRRVLEVFPLSSPKASLFRYYDLAAIPFPQSFPNQLEGNFHTVWHNARHWDKPLGLGG